MKAPIVRALVAALLAVLAVSGGVVANEPGTPNRDALLRELGRGRTTIDRDTGNLSYVAGTRADPAASSGRLGSRATAQSTARAFMARYGTLFGVRAASTDLRVARTERLADTTYVRFEQVQAGVPVIAGELIVQVDAAGNAISAIGEATAHTLAGVGPQLSAAKAAAAARAAVSRDAGASGALTTTEPELAVYDPALLGAPGPAGARLVWRTEVHSADHAVDEYVLVDAATGAIALRFDQVHHLKNRRVCSGSSAYPCTAPVWTEASQPGGQHADVALAFEHSGEFYDFLANRFDRDSFDGAGGALISTVRYCTGCTNYNAFWDGVQTVYWPGMATDDIVAHEFAHGLTEHTSNLLYYHQSGAINEALSDIFGELVDITNGDPDDATTKWQIGEGSSLGVIRDMQSPNVHGQPDRMQSPIFWAFEDDNYGVHVNSGVANKAAFLMVDGGSFNGQNVTGIGIDKAAAIWYRVATQQLWSGSDFADLGAGLNQACSDLKDAATPIYDGTGADTGSPILAADCEQVAKAVLATEMALPPTVPGAVAPVAPACVSGTLAEQFLDTFDSGLGAWTASNSRFGTSDEYTAGAGLTLHGRTPAAAGSGAATRSLGTLPASAFLTFNHAYILDHVTDVGYDGGVVEYSVNGGPWTDASALFTHNGYNGSVEVYNGGNNPLAGRPAFVGWSPGYVTSRLDLSNLAGQAVQLRFVAGTDGDISDYGWFIDDVRLITCAGATDIGPPLVSPPNPNFRTGVQVAGTNPIKLNVSFSATDASGLGSTSLQRRTNTGSWSAVAKPVTATSVDLDYVTNAKKRRQFRSSATDVHGNASGWLASAALKVLAVQNGASAIVQSGTGWKTKSNSSFYGGSVRASGAAGARQRLTRTMSDVAIVTTLGPNRGKFDVYVDNVYRATIDTYSSTTQFKRVAFAWDFGSAGTHTIELRVLGAKNAASSGTRVDFDAFLVLAP